MDNETRTKLEEAAGPDAAGQVVRIISNREAADRAEACAAASMAVSEHRARTVEAFKDAMLAIGEARHGVTEAVARLDEVIESRTRHLDGLEARALTLAARLRDAMAADPARAAKGD